ncbi:hypothetical protein AAC387_Pa01g0613 [Persea americana]
MRWSRRVRLKSPGTVKTSVTPISTSRRATWPPTVESGEASVLDRCMESDPFCDGGPSTSLSPPICVSMSRYR